MTLARQTGHSRQRRRSLRPTAVDHAGARRGGDDALGTTSGRPITNPATGATIVSGAVAERVRFGAFCLFSFGDGTVFVSPLDVGVRIRTGEHGEAAR
jgi:hypothetical protein